MAAMQSYDEPLDWLVKIKALGRDAAEFILISLLHVVVCFFLIPRRSQSQASTVVSLPPWSFLHLFPQMFGTLCNLDFGVFELGRFLLFFSFSLWFKRVAVQRKQQSGPSNSSRLMQIYWKQAGRCECGFTTCNMNEMPKIPWRTAAAAACKPVTCLQA